MRECRESGNLPLNMYIALKDSISWDTYSHKVKHLKVRQEDSDL